MGLGSEAARARARGGIDLWSWSAWVTLCIISYPAVVIALISPPAGLVGGAAAAAFLAAMTGLGYAGRRDLASWRRAVPLSLAGGGATGLAAFAMGGSTAAVSVGAGAAVAGEMVFVWHFVPAMVRDAEAGEARLRSGLQLLPRRGLEASGLRPTLALALLVGFVVLGLGAVWTRGEEWAPSPGGWCVALALLSLGLMFAERMRLFQRSAREGNLLIPVGAFGGWLRAGVLVLAVAALVASALPKKTASETARARWTGTAAVQAPGGLGGGEGAGEGRSESMQAAASAVVARVMSRRVLPLLLLLLLLLAAVVLVWAFANSRPARWLLAVIAAGLARLARAWARLAAAVRRWLFRTPPRPAEAERREEAEAADPFLDVFEDPELLRRLSPREVVIRTYHLLLNFAEVLGRGRAVGQTPFDYAHMLGRAAPGAKAAVYAMTWAYSGAMYAQEDTPLPELGQIEKAWRQAAAALRGEMTPEDFDLRRRAYLAARRLGQQRA